MLRWSQLDINRTKDALLLQIEDRKISRFEPVFVPNGGFLYSNLEGHDLAEQSSLLRHLEKEGFLTGEEFGSILQCKACYATEFCTRLTCKVCESTNITRGPVIEHHPCGNIDFGDKYLVQDENIMMCGKCGKRLKAIGVDYSKPGVFYKCLNCKALLPEIGNSYTCFRCGADWKENDLQQLQLMVYDVNQEKVSVHFAKNNMMPLVAAELYKKHGIVAKSPGKVMGLSKIEHSFDLLISHYETGEPILVADVLSDTDKNPLDKIQILAFYAKCLDANFATKQGLKRFLAVPSEPSKEVRDFADAYGIIILKATSSEDTISTIIEMLRRL